MKTQKNIYLKEIFQNYRSGMILIWGMDILEIVFFLFFPMVIGYAIDGIIERQLPWLFVLIGLQFLYIAISSVNSFISARLYNRIIKEETYEYVDYANDQNIEVSTISARVGFLEEIIYFFQQTLPLMANTFIGLVFVVVYLSIYEYWWIMLCCFASAAITIFIQFRYRRKLKSLNRSINSEQERRVKMIERKNKRHLQNHLVHIFTKQIKLNDIETITYLISYVIQIGLIVATLLLLLFYYDIDMAGAIFAVVSYVYAFTDHTLEVSTHYQDWMWIEDVSHRMDD